MIIYDPTLVDLTSNFLVLCTNLKVYYIIIHSGWGITWIFMRVNELTRFWWNCHIIWWNARLTHAYLVVSTHSELVGGARCKIPYYLGRVWNIWNGCLPVLQPYFVVLYCITLCEIRGKIVNPVRLSGKFITLCEIRGKIVNPVRLSGKFITLCEKGWGIVIHVPCVK